MQMLYQEKIITSGRYTEIDIYPVIPPQRRRGRKARPSTEVQEKLNKRYAEKRIGYLVNANFTEEDIRLDLTYDKNHLPESPEDAQHQCQLFLRRLISFRRKKGLSELKYIYVTEVGEKSGRVHHHIVLSGGVLIKDLARLWGKGYTTVKPLQFDMEYGCTALAEYMVKKPVLKRRWNCSKNLEQPEVRVRTGRISRRKAFEWLTAGMDARNEIEKRYGLKLADIKPLFNDVNRAAYVALSMYDPQTRRREQKGETNGQKAPKGRRAANLLRHKAGN